MANKTALGIESVQRLVAEAQGGQWKFTTWRQNGVSRWEVTERKCCSEQILAKPHGGCHDADLSACWQGCDSREAPSGVLSDGIKVNVLIKPDCTRACPQWACEKAPLGWIKEGILSLGKQWKLGEHGWKIFCFKWVAIAKSEIEYSSSAWAICVVILDDVINGEDDKRSPPKKVDSTKTMNSPVTLWIMHREKGCGMCQELVCVKACVLQTTTPRPYWVHSFIFTHFSLECC